MHTHRIGMASTYTRWINHGETFDEGGEDNAIVKDGRV